jgi:hypothetical protein
MVGALKKTAAKGRTEINRRVRGELAVRRMDVQSRIFDAERASFGHWRWRLVIDDKRLALGAFASVRQTKRGVSYAIRKGVRKVVPHAFVTSGFRHARTGERIESRSVWRRWETSPGRFVGRLPLVFLRGPSIAEVVRTSAVILQEVHERGARDLPMEIQRQTRFVLSRTWRRV